MFTYKKALLIILVFTLFCVFLVVIAISYGAPIPPVKPKRVPPPLELVDGDYTLDWCGAVGTTTLSAGSYNWIYLNQKWVGTCSWDKGKRIVSVYEKRIAGGDTELYWHGTLNNKLSGTVTVKNGNPISITFR